MFLRRRARRAGAVSLPRIRGGVSQAADFFILFIRSSPHTRGCFAPPRALTLCGSVFPAYAGVFLKAPQATDDDAGLPRIRGGVSYSGRPPPLGVQSSPHTRGCFSPSPARLRPLWVFPAYAGVFPLSATHVSAPGGLPRIRGGVSDSCSGKGSEAGSSPHTRGCFPPVPCFRRYSLVFPAYAGCFLTLVSSNLIIVVFPAYAGVFPTRTRSAPAVPGLPRIRGGVSIPHDQLIQSIESSPHTRGCF